MLLSVVIPVYNRERFVDRCLASVIAQDFSNYEIIAVDDGSTDASLVRLTAHADPRLTVIRHDVNRGVGPARNSAIAKAVGDWIVHLDSDDELTPGALARIAEIVATTPETIHSLWFRCRMDDGRACPDPMPSRQDWDYESYMLFLEETRGRWRDVLRCVRRCCFEEVRYPDDFMTEDKFHLDFARRFRIRIHADVVRLYHEDADNRLIHLTRWLDPARDQRFLQDRANGFDALLREHGLAIAQTAPGQYRDYLQLAATSALLADRRLTASARAAALALRSPLHARAWLLMGASLVGPTRSRQLLALIRGRAARA